MGKTNVKLGQIFEVVKPLIKTTLYQSARLPLVKRALRFWQGPCAIFCLHRVLPDEQVVYDIGPNSNLVLLKSRFREILEFLSNRYRVVSLNELIDHLQNSSREFVVCLTFDDGYRDNMEHALPILEQFNCPATVFITTRFPEGDTWMWWYELWEYLQEKERLEIEFEGTQRIWDCSDNSKKNRCYLDLSSWIMMLPMERQKALLSVVTKTEERHSYSNLCLNWDDIKKLDRHPLVTIGAHTHSHPVLSMESKVTARKEIEKSKELLEDNLGHSIEHFAYPFGTSNEASHREYQMAKECGFRSASTANCHTARNTGLFCLPRYGLNISSNMHSIEARLGGLSNALGKQLA